MFEVEEAEPGSTKVHLSCRVRACRVFLLAEQPTCLRCPFSWLAVAGQRHAWSGDPSAAFPMASELDDLASATGGRLFAGWTPYIRSRTAPTWPNSMRAGRQPRFTPSTATEK